MVSRSSVSWCLPFTATALPLACLVAIGSLSSPAAEPSSPSVVVRPAAELRLPSDTKLHAIDSNMPAHWAGDTLFVFTSGGGIPKPLPSRCAGPDLLHLADVCESRIDNDANFHKDRWGRWFEATWKDDSGTLYGWYHNEPGDCCPELKKPFALTSPKIGAAVSHDDGRTWTDLGIVLSPPAGSDDCSTANGFFAGGHGDFSVIPDAAREHLYFLFSTYCGPAEEQGIAVARMRYADRDAPVGKVFKWRDDGWKQPGVGGRCTPVFPAASSWHGKKPDVADPRGWSRPAKIRDAGQYYVQVIGTARGETDKLAGRVARLFVHGRSNEEIVFLRPGESAGLP